MYLPGCGTLVLSKRTFTAALPATGTVPVTGGPTTQLTHLQTTGLFASISPDKKYIACYSGSGLFVMQPDATGLTMLVDGAGGAASSISWVP